MSASMLGLYNTFLNKADSDLREQKPRKAALLQKPITARLANEIVGECPYCGQQMSVSTAASERVYLCKKDRYVAPLPNSELENVA